MKKLFIFSLIALIAISCRKKEDDGDTGSTANTYEQRIAGTWDLDGVNYEFMLPSLIPGGSPTQIKGSAANPQGTFNITHNPNRIDYNYSFNVSIAGFGSIPVDEQQSGDWTISSDEKTIYLEHDDGTSSRLEVIEDLPNKQVYKTVVTQNFAVVGDVDVDTWITLIRQN